MTALEKARRRSAEAGLKYFVYGSVSSALFLFGLSLLYGLTGTTRLEAIRSVAGGLRPRLPAWPGNVAGATAVLLILVGFGFKIAAVPFHQWAPDAYEGAPAPVAAWIASGSKIASFVAMIKVLAYAPGPLGPSRGRRSIGPGWIGVVAILVGRVDDLRQLRRPGPDEPQADARLLVDRPRGLHAGRRARGRRSR